MKTVAGLFQSFEAADRAVRILEEGGFPRQSISVLARDTVVQKNLKMERPAGDVAESAGVGALGGGVVGGLVGILASLGAIAIPGIGPAVAAGSLAALLGTTVGSSAVGAAVGGILGAMTGLSIPEEEAHVFAEGVRRGAVLVAVQAEENRIDAARGYLQDAGAADIQRLRSEWQQAGWTRFEPEPGEDQVDG